MAYLLTFQNTHYAVHSEKIFIKNNLPVSVMALPTSLGDFCGICLRIAAQDLDKGRVYLNKAEIPIEGIFTIEGVNKERTYKRWIP
ncbi:hypothetical protein BCR24_02310 [Enterococcus ureilyticus]|uniref:Putative Se/S carrier protein-like domain-containing protein n=1 Tax=Enterococcus ureilyticus TaxID=1131292 RepID=A0A1E5HDG8_9ENTE|nr:DUF3343 domain-containing protein [Enterococcus ureilyticus]MBM7687806.1 hypothetical protein [Enterococcus ureilyticus]MBO0447003.1 DUF3343 domain-containing protein [Enterococcus ureilyticus]OEG22690.1 hypothetical protein BCR24_02310 [Enterococcus ureilyticus]